jgi:hypothetical protein
MLNLPLLLLTIGSPAHACGQSTHIWTALHALEHLPEGPLAELIRRPDLEQMLVNGTMFPDGGYSPLTGHPYGETAHWEPFQTVYLDHIRETWPDVAADEPAEHVAFLLGLAAHGIGDQYFDAAYLTRSKVIDGWESGDADSSTDVIMMADYGPVPQVETWYPADLFVELFDEVGVDVDLQTLSLGQSSLHFAVGIVAHGAADPDTVAMRRAQYPWAHEHLGDPEVPGSPVCIGELIVAYWQVLWERLHDTHDFEAAPVMYALPADGAVEVGRFGGGIEGALHVVLARGLKPSSLEGRVHLEGPTGEVPLEVNLYYGESSQVLNLTTAEPVEEPGVYTIRLDPGIKSFDGEVAGGWEASFDTEGARACGCRQGAVGWGWWAVLVLAWRRSGRGREGLQVAKGPREP